MADKPKEPVAEKTTGSPHLEQVKKDAVRITEKRMRDAEEERVRLAEEAKEAAKES